MMLDVLTAAAEAHFAWRPPIFRTSWA